MSPNILPGIQKLKERIAELGEQLERERSDMDVMNEHLHAENTKLREALGSIKWTAGSRTSDAAQLQGILISIEDIARQALAGKDTE